MAIVRVIANKNDGVKHRKIHHHVPRQYLSNDCLDRGCMAAIVLQHEISGVSSPLPSNDNYKKEQYNQDKETVNNCSAKRRSGNGERQQNN